MKEPFAKVARAILPKWELSLAFVGPKTAKELNVRLRGKTYTPNVLSYVVGKQHGEVIICKSVARRDARRFGLSYADFTLLLFIHALLHLKGVAHGTTMEKRERALLARYGSASRLLNGTKNRNRNRHRHVSGKDRRRRGAAR